MFKKITTIFSTNQKARVRQAVVMGGVILGIGIGLLLNKVVDPDMVIIEKILDEDDDDFRSSARNIEDLTAEELEQADRNIVGE